MKSLLRVVILCLMAELSLFSATLVSADDKTAPLPSFTEGTVEPQEFVERALSAGVVKLETAKLAMAKSASEEVRHFAQMMIEAHSTMNKELRNLATQKGLTFVNELASGKQADVVALQKSQGGKFDQAYADQQLKIHEETLKLYRQAAKSKDTEIKAFADSVLPSLEHHFSMAQALADTVAKGIAAGGKKAPSK